MAQTETIGCGKSLELYHFAFTWNEGITAGMQESQATFTLQPKVSHIQPFCPYVTCVLFLKKKSDPHFHMWSKIGYESDVLQCNLGLNDHVAFQGQ